MKAINAVIIEDDEFSKFAIRCALPQKNDVQTNEPEVRIVGETNLGIQGLRIVENILPDIVICDIGLPDIDGIEVVEKIKAKFEDRVKILVVSGNLNREVISAAISSGADSYFTKSTDIRRLIEAIRVTAQGDSWLDSNISKILVNNHRNNARLSVHDLTNRELVILKLVCQGLQNEAIANKLCISEGTVRSHTHNIFTKLNVKNRLQAVIKGMRLGIVTVRDMGVNQSSCGSDSLEMRNFLNT